VHTTEISGALLAGMSARSKGGGGQPRVMFKGLERAGKPPSQLEASFSSPPPSTSRKRIAELGGTAGVCRETSGPEEAEDRHRVGFELIKR
jgi:hypothetical protein